MFTIDLINSGKICPYCNNTTEYIDSMFVYGKSWGMIYICKPCDAYVGVHKGTDNALGRLANKELRAAKTRAHASFDAIFRKGLINKIWKERLPDTSNRRKAYIWLAKEMNLPEETCHIGMFDVEDCNRVVALCAPYLLPAIPDNIKPYTGYESTKMIEAKKAIIDLGYKSIYQDEKELRLIHKNSVVRYYPDSGWHTGKSIKDGRGLNNLLAQLAEDNANDNH